MSDINIPNCLKVLSHHIGEKKGIKASDLVEAITGEASTAGKERQLRNTIEHLRLAGWHVCGHPSTGYYMAENEKELIKTCLFLHSRAMKTLRQIAKMRKVSEPDLLGQLRLPT